MENPYVESFKINHQTHRAGAPRPAKPLCRRDFGFNRPVDLLGMACLDDFLMRMQATELTVARTQYLQGFGACFLVIFGTPRVYFQYAPRELARPRPRCWQ